MAEQNVIDLEIVRHLISTKNLDFSLRRLKVRSQQAETSNLLVELHPWDSFLRLPVSLQRTLVQFGREPQPDTSLAYSRDLPLPLFKALQEWAFLDTLDGATYSKNIFINLAPFVEKLNFGREGDDALAWLIVLIYQQQLKSVAIEMYANQQFKLLAICSSHKRGNRFFGPKLRSMSLGDTVLWRTLEKETIGELLSLHRSQLTSLQLDAFRLLPGLDPLPLSRLKHLDIRFRYVSCHDNFVKYLKPCIALKQLQSLSIRLELQPGLRAIINFHQLLTEMTSLKKFSLLLSYVTHLYQRDGNQKPLLYHQPKVQSLMKSVIDQFHKAINFEESDKFAKIQVLRLGAQVPNEYIRKSLPFGDSMAGLELFSLLLMGKLRGTIRKLIIQVPNMFEDEQSKFIRLVNMPQLRVLVLNYSKFHNTDQYFASITKLVSDIIIFPNVRTLTITDIPVINKSICENILKVFPNLVELNIGASRERFYGQEFTDRTFASMISKLKNLRILRFTDDYPKLDKLSQTIKALQVLGESVPLVRPIVLRVPIDRKTFESIQGSPQLRKCLLDSKWLKIY